MLESFIDVRNFGALSILNALQVDLATPSLVHHVVDQQAVGKLIVNFLLFSDQLQNLLLFVENHLLLFEPVVVDNSNVKNCECVQNEYLVSKRIISELARLHVAQKPGNRSQVVEVSQEVLMIEHAVEGVQYPHDDPHKEGPEVLRFKSLALVGLNQFSLGVKQQAVSDKDLNEEASSDVHYCLLHFHLCFLGVVSVNLNSIGLSHIVLKQVVPGGFSLEELLHLFEGFLSAHDVVEDDKEDKAAVSEDEVPLPKVVILLVMHVQKKSGHTYGSQAASKLHVTFSDGLKRPFQLVVFI